VCAKVASSCPRKRKLLTHDDKELLTRCSVEWKEWAIPEIIHIRFELEPNADAAHDENELVGKKELRREGAPSRALPTMSSGGV